MGEVNQVARRYTLAEIEAMRRHVAYRWERGHFFNDPNARQFITRFSYDEQEKIVAVEQMLRTYMLAGLGPEDMTFPPREEADRVRT